MMKLTFLFSLLLVSPSYSAQKSNSTIVSTLPQSIERYLKKCKDQLMVEASIRKSQDSWVEQAPAVSGGKYFRTKTKSFGTWLEVSINSAGSPTLYEVKADATTKLEFTPECKTRMEVSSGLDFSKMESDRLAKWFTDKDLKKRVNSGRAGLIYVWSPNMVYSAKYFHWFREVAKEMKLEFIPLIDPQAKLTFVDHLAKQNGVPPSNLKMNSVEIFMRSATIHFPSSLVYKDGKIHDLTIVGVMPKDEIHSQIQLRLDDLKLKKN